MKRCSVCGEVKALDDFPLRAGTPDGRRANCKVCKSEQARLYREANAEKERKRKIVWCQQNEERVRAKKRAAYLAHREEVIERVRARYERQREEILAERRARHAANPARRLAANRARQALTSGAASAEVVRRDVVFERDAGCCGICGELADPSAWHLDHIEPLSAGGSHTYENVRVTHPRCNLVKGATRPSALAA